MPKGSKISDYEREKIREVAWSWHELRGSRPTSVELAGELLRRPTWMPFADGGENYPPRSADSCKRILAQMKFPVLDDGELWSLADTDNQGLGIPDDATGFLLEVNEYAFVRGFRFTKLQAKYASKLRWNSNFRDPENYGYILRPLFDTFFISCAVYAGLEKDGKGSQDADLQIQLNPIVYMTGRSFGWTKNRSLDELSKSITQIDPRINKQISTVLTHEAAAHAQSVIKILEVSKDPIDSRAASGIYELWITMFNRIQSNVPLAKKREAELMMAQEIVGMIATMKSPTQYVPSLRVLKRLNISAKSIRKVIEDGQKKNTQSN